MLVLRIHPLFALSSPFLHRSHHPPQYQRVNPTPMFTFNEWRPKKLVEQGDQLISAAVHELHLLEAYGAELSQPRRNQAQSLLDQ